MQSEVFQIELYESNEGESPFERWFISLANEKAKAIIRTRLARVRLGTFGDRRPVGGGVMELRIDYGQGLRIYYTMRNNNTVLLLTAGDKRSQNKDIKNAISYWQNFKRKKDA